MLRLICRLLVSRSIHLRALALAIGVLCPALAHAQVGQVRISQIFASGGTGSSLPRADYVELFNAGDTTVSLAGWSVQSAAPTGLVWTVTPLNGSIGPKKYYLVQVGAPGVQGVALAADATATNTFDLQGSGGKVALLNTTAQLSGNPNCPFPASVIDFVGWGSANQRFPCNTGFNAPSFAGSNAIFRLCGGKRDVGSNSDTFQVATAAPRNSASSANTSVDVALTADAPVTIFAGEQAVVTVTATTSSCAGQIASVTGDLSSIGGPASVAFTRISSSSQYRATLDLTSLNLAPGTYTFPIAASATLISEKATVTQTINIRPANDECAGATLVQNFVSTFFVRNEAAQPDVFPNNCADGNTSSHGVWFRVIPRGPGQLSISEGGGQDVAIAAYTGSCGTLTNVACTNAEDLAVRTDAESVLVLVVRDTPMPPNLFDLVVSFDFIGAPSNDACETAYGVTLAPNSTVGPFSVLNDGALDDTVPGTCASGGIASRGVWFRTTVPESGRLTINEDSTQEVSIAAFTGSCAGLSLIACSNTAQQLEVNASAGDIISVLVWRPNAATDTADALQVRFTLTPTVVPPANDTCAAPIDVNLTSGTIGPFQVDNNSATPDLDPGSCTPSAQGDNGVWFRVTLPTLPAQGGTVRVIESSAQDVAIARLDGTCPQALNVLNCTNAEELSFTATGGQSFYILVVRDPANQPSAPSLSVSFEFTPVVITPTNDLCTGAAVVDLTSVSSVGPIIESNSNATSDADPGSCTPSAQGDFGVWFRILTPAQPGMLTVTESGAQNVAFGVYTGSCGALTNTLCSAEDQISISTSPSQELFLLVVRDPADQGSPADLNLSFSFAAAVVPPENDLPCNAKTLTLAIAAGGTTMNATVDGDGPVVSCSPSPIGGGPGVWYSFTPATSGTYSITTCFSPSDTDLAVFTLSGCPGAPVLSPIASACDSASCGSGSTNARLASLNLLAGVPYLIRVSNPTGSPTGVHTIRVDAIGGGACCDPASGACFLSTTGSCSQGLNFQGNGTVCDPNSCPPGANDECTTPAPIVLGVAITSTNAAANTSSSLSGGGCAPASGFVDGKDVFFRFVPTVSTQYEITLCGSRFDTTLSIHSGCPATAVNRIVCNDNSFPVCAPGEPSSSRIASTQMLAGTPYIIRVAGVSNATGQFTLLINAAGVCCRGSTCSTVLASATACAASLPANSGVGVSFVAITAGCNTSVNATSPCCLADFNKAGGVTLDDLFIFLDLWFRGSIFTDITGNGSSAPTLDDIFVYLNVWFAGC
jgi:hypothetical protein